VLAAAFATAGRLGVGYLEELIAERLDPAARDRESKCSPEIGFAPVDGSGEVSEPCPGQHAVRAERADDVIDFGVTTRVRASRL